MEWYLGLQGQGLEEDFGGYFTTLGGRILDPKRRFLVLVWLGRKRWFSMKGFGAGRLVVLARWWRSLILESGSAHFVALLTVGTLACRAVAIGVGQIGIGSLVVQVLGALLVVKVRGMGSNREWLVRGQVGGGGFLGQGGVGSAMGGLRWFGPTGRDQTHVPQGEPTFRCPRSGEECGCSWCWSW